MPNNCLSVLYKHIIQVENKNVGGHKHTIAPPNQKIGGGGTCPNCPPPTSYASASMSCCFSRNLLKA